MSAQDGAQGRAWATLLTQPDYLPGVRTLRASLERVGSPYPLVVVVTAGIDQRTRDLLIHDGCVVRDVEPIRPPSGLTDSYANARFAEVWTKLNVWSMTEYDRLGVLDADMLVVANMDELLELELDRDQIAACHACRCNPNRIASYPPSWVPQNCAYTHLERGDPDVANDPSTAYLNGGTLVLRPDRGTFDAMTSRLAAIEDLAAYPFAEQDFLNEQFAGRWSALPYVYNALKTLPHQHPLLWDANEVKNVHFIIDKPWQKTPDPDDRYYDLDRRWWEVAETSWMSTSTLERSVQLSCRS